MTTAAPSSALATIQPVFTDHSNGWPSPDSRRYRGLNTQ